jgi:hypothetical protein
LRFVEELASGGSLADGATAARVSVRSAKRWHRRPEIQAAIRERSAEQVASARGVLAAGMAKAARSLVSMAAGESEADGPRVSACRAVLDTAVGLTDLADMTARLDALEMRHERP